MTLKREIKDAYIEGGNSIYVKTHSNAIYVDDNETETLTQRLDDVKDSITEHTSQLNDLAKKNYTTETIFKNGWVLENGGTIIKNGNIVLINMNISDGVATSGTTAFTVPSEIAPKSVKNIIAFNYSNTGYTPVLCALGTDGNMNLAVGINNNLALRFQVSYCIEE